MERKQSDLYPEINQPVSDIKTNCTLTDARAEVIITITSVGKEEGEDMKKLPQISEAEFEVMRIVWDQGPVSTNEVTDQLVQSTDWSPKTIQTLIRRLVTKGALTYEKKGRMFVYTAAVEEGEYLRSKTLSFVEHYFSGNISALVSAYIESAALSAEDIESLRGVLSEVDKNRIGTQK